MKPILWFWFLLLTPLAGWAQPSAPVSLDLDGGPEITESETERAHRRAVEKKAYKLRVRYVKVEGRWADHVQVPLVVGEVLTPEKQSAAIQALRTAITTHSTSGYGYRSQGEIRVLYIDIEYDTGSEPAPGVSSPPVPHTVGVIFRVIQVGLSLVKIGDNILTVPRSPHPTFYENVPAPLLALRPAVGVSYDRAFGTSLDGAFNVDLLNVAEPAKISAGGAREQHFDFQADGSKSLTESFYRVGTGLRYSSRHTGKTLHEFAARVARNDVKEPLGASHHRGRSQGGGVSVTLKLAPVTRLTFDTGYRRTDDTLSSAVPNDLDRTVANEQTNRVLFESITPRLQGFLRAAAWHDYGWQKNGQGSYRRIAGRIGYAKEFAVAPNQSVGVELIAGAGQSWGHIPPTARFYGGNSGSRFLYDSPTSAASLNFPVGPLIRSFGSGEAGLRPDGGSRLGGDAFWHLNLTVTIPLPRWSRPLIPNEATDVVNDRGKVVTIKEMLRQQIDVTGPSMLAAVLRKEGMSTTDARLEAARILDEIRPAAHYIIEDANVFSLKPMLMIDAAGLRRETLPADTWVAVGGGLQLTVVTAKFETGYMHTVSGPEFDRSGSFFFRLVFQNLF